MVAIVTQKNGMWKTAECLHLYKPVPDCFPFLVTYLGFCFFFPVCSGVAVMPQTRSQAQGQISFPKKKLPGSVNKSKNSGDVRQKATSAQSLSSPPSFKVLPLSPRKRLGKLR